MDHFSPQFDTILRELDCMSPFMMLKGPLFYSPNI